MKRLFLYCLLFLLSHSLFSQSRIRFQNYTISNGLSQSSVNGILQDSKGFIWIATQDGLNRFDGYNFRVFKNSPSNASSLSNNFILGMCDDGNGNLWLGTDGGGLNIFSKSTEKSTRINLGNDFRFIYALVKNGNNMLVGSERGGIKSLDLKTHKAKDYLDDKALGTGYVQSMYIQKGRYLWIGTGDNGLMVQDMKTGDVRTFKQAENFNNPLASDIIWCITENDQGDIWVATNAGLYKIWGSFGNYKFDRLSNDPANRSSISSNSVRTVYITQNNNILVGTSGSGLTIIKDHVVQGHYAYHHYQASDYIPNSLAENNVNCLMEDRSGCVWIGTSNGLSRYDPAKQGFELMTVVYNQPYSLDDKQVWSFAESPEGNYWVGTRRGLNLVVPSQETVYHFAHKGQNRTAANDNSIFSLYLDRENQLWVGAIDGFFKMNVVKGNPGGFTSVPFKPNFDKYGDNRVYRIAEDDEGFLWLATKQGLSVINKKTEKFWFFSGSENGSKITLEGSPIIRCVFVDSKNIKWVSTDDGYLYRFESKKNGENLEITNFKKYNLFKALEGNNQVMITSMWEDRKGIIWMGTFGAGLMRFDPAAGTRKFYTEGNGLPNNVVYGVLGDKKGSLWMSTNKGLCTFDPVKQKFRNYEEKDGLQSNEFNTGAYFKGSTGEMLFGGINGYTKFNPENIQINTRKPQVVITDVFLFNKRLEPGEKDSPLQSNVPYQAEIDLNYKQNNLSFYYSALHFSNPENNRYKYLLEGADEAESNMGSSRSAHYTKLSPGTYTFKVYASNSDGVWSEKPAVLVVHINPPFWKTWWFRGILIILALLLLYGIWQARMYAMKTQRLKLAKEVRERTREVMLQNQKIEEQNKALEAEKEKVENLLMNVLPKDTAEELKTRGKASARSYRQVTVMFTDFKGFTKQAEKMRPSDLVERLDSYFIEFDELIQKFGLEKIKTIGDSYMCAGGLPIRNKSNPIDTVLAALDIQKTMGVINRKFSDDGQDPWELRIGINTGEVIAGVIGIKRFAYDIWGSTVNVASRMETASEPGMINVSGSTFAEIEPFFECTYRGKIATKNTGEIDMYYVHRIKPGLSEDEEGVYPNEKFKKYVDLHLFSSINYKKAERHIMKVLKEGLPDNLYYHGIHHTYDVVEAVERIALLEGITGEEMFVLKSAATYHDAGFVKQYAKNEPIGIDMAKEILPIYGYTPEQVEEVEKLIYATIIPHNPQSHLQEIICDADLDYLGRDDFHQIADTLRMELTERGIVTGKRPWDEMQVKFLTMHKYFTASAIKLRQVKKEKHIEEIKQRLLEKYDDEE